MQVTMTTPMADALGRIYRPKQIYEVDDAEGERLVAAGFARRVLGQAETVVAGLKALGGGLVVTAETDAALVAMATAAKVPLHRPRGPRGSDGR